MFWDCHHRAPTVFFEGSLCVGKRRLSNVSGAAPTEFDCSRQEGKLPKRGYGAASEQLIYQQGVFDLPDTSQENTGAFLTHLDGPGS